MIFNVLQLIGGCMLVIGYVPQIIKIINRKTVGDISLSANVLISLGITLMEVYAIDLLCHGEAIMFFVTNTMSLMCAYTVLCLVWIYGK